MTPDSYKRKTATAHQPHRLGLPRRDFLKAVGAGLAAVGTLSACSAPLLGGLLAPRSPEPIAFGASLVRGTLSGQILQSQDEGKTWQQRMSFGEHCSVCSLLTREGQIYAQLSVSGHTFWLVSTDTRIWRNQA